MSLMSRFGNGLRNVSRKNIKFAQEQATEIPPTANVTVMRFHNKIQITILDRQPQKFKTRRISNDKIFNLGTGEVLHLTSPLNRENSTDSLKKTFKKLEALALNNFSGNKNEAFVTLGYDGEYVSPKTLSHDLKLFWRKVRRKHTNIEYLVVLEYTSSGLLHIHAFIKDVTKKTLWFDRDWLCAAWGQNNVYIQPIKGQRGIERLAKYVNIFQNPKKRDRVKFYQPNCQIFRHSKGIVYPPTEKMTYAEAMELVEGMKLQNKERFSVNVVSVDGETAKVQGIQKEVYYI